MKKFLSLVLAATIAMSMAACNSDAGISGASNGSEPASVSEDAALADDVEEAPAAVELPDFDNFIKNSVSGVTTYTTVDGSSISVASTLADSTTLDAIKNKDKGIADQFNQQAATTAGGAEVHGEFVTLGGKSVFALSMDVRGVRYTIYYTAASGSLYALTGISMGTDLEAPMAEIIKSI